MPKKQQKSAAHKHMETNEGHVPLCSAPGHLGGVGRHRVRWARTRVAYPQATPDKGIRAEGASACGFEAADYDLRANQGIQCGQQQTIG